MSAPGTAGPREIAPEWVAADLAGGPGPGEAHVVSVHETVVNLSVASWTHLLMVAGPQVHRGPSAVGLSAAGFAVARSEILAGATVRVEPTALVVAGPGAVLRLGLVGPAVSFAPPPAFDAVPSVCRAGLPAALDALRSATAGDLCAVLLGADPAGDPLAAPLADAFPALLRALVAGHESGLVEATRRLAGVGYGSTPTGDDLIHGALVAAHYLPRHARARQVFGRLPSELSRVTTRLGAHMIDVGCRGLTPEPTRAFLLDLLGGRSVGAAVRALDAMGADSGRAVAVGAALTVAALLDPVHEGEGTP